MTTETINEIVPPVNIAEDEDSVCLTVEMPGADPDTVSVTVENDTLTICGMRENRLSDCSVIRRETEQGEYRRVFNLSRDLGREGITADYKLGVLGIRIPRAEHTKPHRIEIRTDE